MQKHNLIHKPVFRKAKSAYLRAKLAATLEKSKTLEKSAPTTTNLADPNQKIF